MKNYFLALLGLFLFSKAHCQDSLMVDHEKWCIQKVSNNHFLVSRSDSNFLIQGTAYSISPFIKNGDYIYLNSQNDTLLTVHYDMDKMKSYSTLKTQLKDSVYTLVDKNPIFPIKYGKLSKYISERLKYPKEFNECCIQGRVIIQVVITSTGEVTNIKVIKSLDPLIDLEAVKVVVSLPNFEPGEKNGKCVNTYFIFLVPFGLN